MSWALAGMSVKVDNTAVPLPNISRYHGDDADHAGSEEYVNTFYIYTGLFQIDYTS